MLFSSLNIDQSWMRIYEKAKSFFLLFFSRLIFKDRNLSYENGFSVFRLFAQQRVQSSQPEYAKILIRETECYWKAYILIQAVPDTNHAREIFLVAYTL